MGTHYCRPTNCHTKQLSDTDRIRIRTLFFEGGLTKQQIASRTGFSIAQVKQAVKSPTARPQSGRPPALSHKQEQQLVEYVTSSQQGRLATFL
ncbi:hypothetical protein LZ30DRAFT_705363 [Colletotrichum cereale]|nr:hypothetical protein LZ30DRAFT_705363 [Colletotrichum cereale]